MGAIYGARSIVQRETQAGQGQHAFIPEEQNEDLKSGINDIIGQLDFYLSKADTHELGEVRLQLLSLLFRWNRVYAN